MPGGALSSRMTRFKAVLLRRSGVAEAAESERLFTGYTGRVFLTVSFGWLLIQLGRQVLPPLLPTIIDDLGITTAEAGFALTVLWGLYALAQYPSGRLSDRLTRKTLLVGGVVLLAGGFALIAQSRGYPAFVLGASVIGVGAGLYPSAARAFVSDLFVRRRGQAFGLHTAAGDLGNAAAAGLAVLALAFAGWQSAFLPVIVLLGATGVAIHLLSRETYALERVDLEIRETARRLFATARLRGLLVAYALFAFTWQSTTGFLPAYLQAEKGLDVALASGGFALLFVVGALVKPVSGLLGDRFGRVRVSVAALLLGVAGLGVLLLAEGKLAVFLGVSVFAAGLMAFPPVMQAFLMDGFPTESMGGDLGAMRSFYIGVGSLGPTYVGVVAAASDYTTAFAGLVICLVLSAAIVAARAG